MNQPLPHAGLIAAAARGEVIQRATAGDWKNLQNPLHAIYEMLRYPEDTYRLAPKTITISITNEDGVTVTNEVPAPYRGEMELGREYWVASPLVGNGIAWRSWGDSETDREFRASGFIHLDKESASKHGRALRGEKV